MTAQWQPYREPLRITLLRTGMIALVGGAVWARWWGGLSHWPLATLLMLWPSFGGHWVELWFLNWLRPRLLRARAVQVVARVGAWFVGGIAFWMAMVLTTRVLTGFRPPHGPAWWIAGAAFIAVELTVHLAMQLRGQSSFYNGRG